MENQDVAKLSGNSSLVKSAIICLVLAWIFALLPIPFISMTGMTVMNIVAFVLAIICLTKNAVKAGVWVLIGSLIGTPLMYFLGLAILGAGLGSAVSGYGKHVAQTEESALAGDWTGQFTYDNGAKADFKMVLKGARKDAFSGNMSETDPRSKQSVHSTISGNLVDSTIIFTQKYRGQPDVTCSGLYKANTIELGTCVAGTQSVTFTARKN